MQSNLLTVPTNDTEWSIWSQANRFDHDEIRQAIQAQGGPNLAAYVLDAIPFFDFRNWAERHQQTHLEMNSALGAQGVDLLDVDPTNVESLSEWVWVHLLEHQAARSILRI